MSTLALTEQTSQTFFKFNAAMAEKLRSAKLTTSDWKLWSYLVTLDPFGDRYIKIESVDVFAKACGLTRSCFFRAKNKLKELCRIDFQGGEIYRKFWVENPVLLGRLYICLLVGITPVNVLED